jgi:hypothetical protein
MMKSDKRESAKAKLQQSTLYRWMQGITKYMDQYYLDAAIGLIPGGIGDFIGALFSLVHLYFSIFIIRSIPLALAIINNTLRDIFLGLIPFYVGDVIDVFHRSNKKNMQLIDGFIENDTHIIHEVNKKAIQTLVIAVCFIIAIILMLKAIIWVAQSIGTTLFS